MTRGKPICCVLWYDPERELGGHNWHHAAKGTLDVHHHAMPWLDFHDVIGLEQYFLCISFRSRLEVHKDLSPG